MKKVTIKVSNQELDALEDLLYAWTLCKKHNVGFHSEVERFRFTQTCPKCFEMNNSVRHKAGSIWRKLVHEYGEQESLLELMERKI